MKFKELYSERGEKRPYVLGEDGQEYFFYQDRTGYTIREMSLDDIHEWYKMMEETYHQYKEHVIWQLFL